MAKSQEDGITILPRVKGHEVGKVSENEEEIMVEVRAGLRGIDCPRCGSMRLYRYGLYQRRKLLYAGDVRGVAALSLMELNSCDLTPGSPGKLR